MPPKAKTASGSPDEELNYKQKLFCLEYIVDLNGTQAAIRAGYSSNTAGQIADEHLKKPKIQKEIDRLFEERAQRTMITADRVLTELANLAFSDITAVMEWDTKKGVRLKDSASLTPAQRKTIAEISTKETINGREFKVKTYSKDAALTNLMKHLGLFEKDNSQKDTPIKIEVVRKAKNIDHADDTD